MSVDSRRFYFLSSRRRLFKKSLYMCKFLLHDKKAMPVCRSQWLLFVISAFPIYVSGAANNACSFWEGSHYVDGYCYKLFQAKFTWYEAQNFCQMETRSGRLAEPITETRLKYLRSLSASLQTFTSTMAMSKTLNQLDSALNPILQGTELWLGGMWNADTSTYLWSGTGMTILYNCLGILSNCGTTPGNACVKMDSQAQVTGELCTKNLSFVCEQSTDIMPCYFWEGATYHEGSCYKPITSPLGWDSAQLACQEETGKLAQPWTEDRLWFLRQLVMQDNNSYWIGGHTADNGTLTSVWASSQDTINLTSWMIGEPNGPAGSCLQINGMDWKLLSDQECGQAAPYICEKYIGDLCQESLPAADYFAGYCYKYHELFTSWNEAQAICESENSILAEAYTMDIYRHLSSFASKKELEIVVPRNSSYMNLNRFHYIVPARVSAMTMAIKACQEARIALWSTALWSGRSVNKDVGGDYGSYYEVIIDRNVDNVGITILSYCSRGKNCTHLGNSTGSSATKLDCQKFIYVRISWNTTQTLSIYQGSTITPVVNVTLELKHNIPITTYAVSMGDAWGVWRFTKHMEPMNETVFLGGMDVSQDSVFVWRSNKKNVSLYDWKDGEPNNYKGKEDRLGLSGVKKQLNDVDGAVRKSRFICQADSHIYTYLLALPKLTNLTEPHLRITTNYSDFVYMDVAHRVRGKLVTSRTNVTANISRILNLDTDPEMTETGIYLSSTTIRSNRYITVVLYFKIGGSISGSLVLSMNKLFKSYFIISHSSSSFGNQLVIVALENSTEVTITFPRTNQGIVISSGKWSYGQPRFIRATLAEGETWSLQCSRDLSGGFVLAIKPVAVYITAPGRQINNTVMVSGSDTVLPVYTLTSDYFVFPSSRTDKLKVLALWDNTNITVHSAIPEVIRLERAGDVGEVMLPELTFIYLESNLPFSATKMVADMADGCITPLIPSTLWRSHYDFDIRLEFHEIVSVVLPTRLVNRLLDGGKPVHFFNPCQRISGTEMSGCHFSVTAGVHHVYTDDPEGKFVAYTQGLNTKWLGYCNALGVEDLPSANLSQLFQADIYSNLSDCSPFELELNDTLDQTTVPATSMDDYTTSTSLHTTTTVDNMSSTTVTVDMSSTTAQNCLPNRSPLEQLLNLTQEEVDLMVQKLQAHLLLDVNNISSHRRKKQSVADLRVSAVALGVTGVVVLVAWGLILSFNDFISVLGYIFGRSFSRTTDQ